MVHEEWSLQPLSEVASYIGSGISRPFFTEAHGVPVLRSNNVKNGEVNSDNLKYWHEVDPKGANLETVRVRKNDLLVNFVNGSQKELGKAGIYRGEPKNCIASTNFFIVRFHEELFLPEFANYFFQSEAYRRWLYVVSGFSGQGSFNQSEFRKLFVPTASVEEQAKIVDILNLARRQTALVERLIENANAQKKALMQQLLTGKRRLPGFEKSAALKDTKYGAIPADWSFIQIRDIAGEVSERNEYVRNYPVLSCSKYEGFVNSLEYFKKKVYSDDTSNYKIIRNGDFGFPSNHIEEGSIGFQDLCNVGIVSPIYTIFRTNEAVHDGYLYKLLKTEHYRQIFAANTNASVDRRGSLRWKEFSKIRVPVPSYEEQAAISTVIDLAESIRTNYENQKSSLESQKKALMQQLLTGERRVNTDPKAA